MPEHQPCSANLRHVTVEVEGVAELEARVEGAAGGGGDKDVRVRVRDMWIEAYSGKAASTIATDCPCLWVFVPENTSVPSNATWVRPAVGGRYQVT